MSKYVYLRIKVEDDFKPGLCKECQMWNLVNQIHNGCPFGCACGAECPIEEWPLKEVYSIYTTDTEYSGSNKALYGTLEEAQSHIMEFCNFYCGPGSCEIRKWEFGNDHEFPQNYSEAWRYHDGKLVNHYKM